MLIPLEYLFMEYGLDVTGVVHAGAHLGEEARAYRKCGIEKVVWIEANPLIHRKLRRVLKEGPFKQHLAINAVVSSEVGQEVEFNVANNGESSSLLELGTHLREHPEVFYESSFKATTTTIDEICEEHDLWDYNFLNLDLQGAELLALQGSTKFLKNVKYVYSEVNVKRLYKNCALTRNLDAFLEDFDRVETEMTVHGWGDAFYVRESEFA